MGGEGGRRRKKVVDQKRELNAVWKGELDNRRVSGVVCGSVCQYSHALYPSLCLPIALCLSLSFCLPACVSACNCFCLAIPGVLQTIMRLLMVSASSPVSVRHSTSLGKAVKNFGLRTDAVLLIKSHVILFYRLCWVMASISLIEKRAATKSGFYTWQTASLLPHPPAFRFYINECNFETPEPNDMNMDMAKAFTTLTALGNVFGG